jgi:hypothetical protein
MMKRRDLFSFGRPAALSAFTATTISRRALFAQESQLALDSMEGRVAGLLQAYDAQGEPPNRTGGG